VDTANIEATKTVQRLQQLHRDIGGCLQNTRQETEQANTILPPTADRRGHLATWGRETGRLTYAGDPDEGGEDPTNYFLRSYNNLDDLDDAEESRENLGVVQGHAVNSLPQRGNLFITGAGVSVLDRPEFDTTIVTLSQTVRTFSDLSGILSIAQGGTGATSAADARKNLGLAAVAASADFRDLKNIPAIISHMPNTGSGVGVVGSIINGVAAVRSLISPDGSIGISKSDNEIELRVAEIPVELAGHVVVNSSGGDMPQRRRLQFAGFRVEDRGDAGRTVVAAPNVALNYTLEFSAASWTEGKITVPPNVHGLGVDGNLLVSVRDLAGNDVLCGTAVDSTGVVTLETLSPFAGRLLITAPKFSVEPSGMQNPLREKGDLLWSVDDIGTPWRIPVGSVGQILTVFDDRNVGYETPGNGIWRDVSVPYGLAALDGDAKVPYYFLPDDVLGNPMTSVGDVIFSDSDEGVPARLPIGTEGQVLSVSSAGIPHYESLGEAARLETNEPNGVLKLDDAGLIPEDRLPISPVTFKGSFGSSVSTTGGDLPASASTGDEYFCDTDGYESAVAGTTFTLGQFAIHSEDQWVAVPVRSLSDPSKANVDGSNLDPTAIEDWRDGLGLSGGCMPGGTLTQFSGNTVYGPLEFDLLLMCTLYKADDSYGQILIGDTETTVTTEIATYQSAGDHGGSCFVCAKIPNGKYLKVTTNRSAKLMCIQL
jgi:hypothetical protein